MVASQPMWLHWVSESGKPRRHAPDFFARRADGTGVLVDVRPDDRVLPADQAVFDVTAAIAAEVGWAYDRVGELPAIGAANLRWLAGYRHPRFARAAVVAALAEVFAEPGPLRAGAARVVSGSDGAGIPRNLGGGAGAGGHGPALLATGVLPVRRPAP